jgi:hypothetical protein
MVIEAVLSAALAPPTTSDRNAIAIAAAMNPRSNPSRFIGQILA